MQYQKRLLIYSRRQVMSALNIHHFAKTLAICSFSFFLFACEGTTISADTDTSDSEHITTTGDSDSDVVDIPVTPVTTPTKIYLTTDRINQITATYNSNNDVWQYFIGRLDQYIGATPYNSGEYSAAYALAYRITGNTDYRDKSIELFWVAYADWDYTSRNGFRSNNQWAHYTYDWLRDTLTSSEKTAVENLFKTWADYWLTYVDIEDNFAAYRVEDSDETTSLAENFLFLALSLENDSIYATKLFNAADTMLSDFIVGSFMNDIMAGGMWGEGTDYSPATMQHWIRQFLINKEYRGISYPTNYLEQLVDAMWHSTYPGFTGMFEYGDMEGSPTDYTMTTHEYRDSLMLVLIEAVNNPTKKALAQDWLNKARLKDGGAPSASIYTGMWRVLFEPVTPVTAISPASADLSTTHYASGIEFLSFRDNWTDNGTVVYFQNSKANVDHQHFDALSFNIISDGVAITKEMTGYGDTAWNSTAHNTLLIENASSDGSSSPTGRPAGEGEIISHASDSSFGFVDADATQLYNMSGYFAENYADRVNRKLLYLKSNKVIVYDSVDINSSYSPRWKKYIQRFQAQPALVNDTYVSTNEGKSLYFRPILPANRNTTIVDESVLYAGKNESNAPANQRRWHLSISPSVNTSQTEFLNLIFFDDEAASPSITSTVLEDNSQAFKGLYLTETGSESAVLFNKSTSPANGVNYTITTSNSSSHYITGLSTGSNYEISTNKSGQTISITITQGSSVNSVSTNNGVLKFTLDSLANLQ